MRGCILSLREKLHTGREGTAGRWGELMNTSVTKEVRAFSSLQIIISFLSNKLFIETGIFLSNMIYFVFFLKIILHVKSFSTGRLTGSVVRVCES